MTRKRLREIVHDLCDRKCVWCGKRVFLSKADKRGHLRHDASTIDHVDQVMDGNRGPRCRVVCACHACNARRSQESIGFETAQRRVPETVPDGVPMIIVDSADEIIFENLRIDSKLY